MSEESVRKDWEYFKLEFDPNPSEKYPFGYWDCYIVPGFDGVGPTPEIAMAQAIIGMSKYVMGLDDG